MINLNRWHFPPSYGLIISKWSTKLFCTCFTSGGNNCFNAPVVFTAKRKWNAAHTDDTLEHMQDRGGWYEGGDSGEPQESLWEQPRRDQQEVQADTEQALRMDSGRLWACRHDWFRQHLPPEHRWAIPMWAVLRCFHQPMLLPHWPFCAPGTTEHLLFHLHQSNMTKNRLGLLA